MYYLRTKPAVNAIQYTVEKDMASQVQVVDDSEVCLSCQAWFVIEMCPLSILNKI